MKFTNEFYLIIIIFLFTFQSLKAQNHNNESSLEEILIDPEEENQKYPEDIINSLESLQSNPVNINTADRYQLEQIIFLNPFQIQSILDYRKNYGPFLSINELIYVFGFNAKIIDEISPYISLDISSSSIKNNRGKMEISNRTDFKTSQQKINNNIPIKISNRIMYEKGRFKSGIIMEQDPFEDFFRASNKTGFDFYSGFIKYETEKKRNHSIILGCYNISWGQGLNIWGGYGSSKSADISNIQKRTQGIKPSGSVNESNYFRGLATHLNFDEISIDLFVSYKKIDASIENDSGYNYITSLKETGLHRTIREIEDEDNSNNLTGGINLCYNKDWGKTGISISQTHFSIPYQINNTPEKMFLPAGNDFRNISYYYSLYIRNLVFFGEWAISENYKQAFLSGILVNPGHGTNLSILYRNYDKGYLTLYGNAFGENSNIRNERGVYLAVSNESIKNLKIHIFADYYKFPWITYKTSAPSQGTEYGCHSEYRLQNDVVFSLKVKTETKQRNSTLSEETHLKELSESEKRQFQIQLQYNIGEKLQFKNRLTGSSYVFQNSKFTGFLVFQDIKYSLSSIPLTLYGRYCIFDAENFETRIYQYENDLRYTFYMPFLYGKGSKTYFMLKYRMIKYLEILVKTEHIVYLMKKNDHIFKLQLNWNFI